MLELTIFVELNNSKNTYRPVREEASITWKKSLQQNKWKDRYYGEKV
jgi:hypothetical protein